LVPPSRSTLFIALYASAVALPSAVLAIVHLGAGQRGALLFWIAVILVPMLALGTAICVLLADRHVRGISCRRVCAHREQPVHHRGDPHVLVAPE
ncbi:MAG: hypothetical protein ACHQQR_07140, partial [Gemmatimonadales bacterium]